MNVPTAPAGVEFDILANYNPLPEGESYTKPVHGEADNCRTGCR